MILQVISDVHRWGLQEFQRLAEPFARRLGIGFVRGLDFQLRDVFSRRNMIKA